MKVFYSPSSNGFYHEGLQKDFPLDKIELTQERYNYLMGGISLGQIIVVKEGVLTLAERPPLDSSPQLEHLWIDSEMHRIREEIEKVQDTDPGAVGTVSAWRTYRKALRVWCEDINFPNKAFRPTSPHTED